MVGLCCTLWFISLGFAALHDEWVVWGICATLLVIIPGLLFFLVPGTRGSRIGIGLCLMGFAALMVDESHGVIETHFAYFTLLAVLIYYRDWRPILASSCVVTAQHLLFCWLQMHGYPVFLFEQHHNMGLVFVHAAYVAVETSFLIFLTLTIRLEALESSAIAAFGERISATGLLDLTFDSERHKGAAARGLTCLLAALQTTTRNAAALATRIDGVSEDIALTSTRILENARNKTTIIDEVSHSVEGMSEASARIKADCVAVAQVASHSASIVAEGCSTMEHTAKLMLVVAQTATSTVAEIDELHAESARIESIVRIMNDLSNQSSLLALNASIEAARAGEKGKGFQVVAQEIRTLSERSYQSLAEVQSIVDTIGLRITELHTQAHRCQTVAAESGSYVSAARNALAEVSQRLPAVAQRAERVVETAEHHTGLSSQILFGMARITEVVQKNNLEVQDFAKLSHALEDMSDELSDNVNQFQPSRSDVAPVLAPQRGLHLQRPLSI